MHSETIEFSFDEMKPLAALIRYLNEFGVPYSLRKDNVAIAITIHRGF